MRIANLSGRLVVLHHDGAADVERASAGRFSSDPAAVYERWDEFERWMQGDGGRAVELEAKPYDHGDLGAPSPRPRQLLAIGLNYRAHAAEADVVAPDAPAAFGKFSSSVAGASTEVIVGADQDVDWEAELVAVVGRQAWHVKEADAWSHVAGLTVGQDLSDRRLQFSGPAPQWGLAKSLPGFSPIGPMLVTPDELPDPDDLEIGCLVNGEEVQRDRTSSLIFSVSGLVAWLSSIVPLLPGDVLFTGTPAGVGFARSPQRFLHAGDSLVTWIEGIGEIRQQFV